MIKRISIDQVLDSRKNRQIRAILYTNTGTFYGCAPSGISTGKYEAKVKSNSIAIKEFEKIIQ